MLLEAGFQREVPFLISLLMMALMVVLLMVAHQGAFHTAEAPITPLDTASTASAYDPA